MRSLIRRMQMPVLVVALVVVTALSGCGLVNQIFGSKTATQTLLVSEALLTTTGEQFINASTEATRRCNARPRISPMSMERCNSFDAFSAKFKPGFHHAVGLWEVGKRTKDTAMAGDASATINRLIAELAPFASELLSGAAKGGK